METVNWIQVGLTLLAGVAGMAIGYARMKDKASRNEETILAIKEEMNVIMGYKPGTKPLFVREEDDAMRHASIENSITLLNARLDHQAESLSQLRNFARWWLTAKEGMTLIEANNVLGNGQGRR